MNKLNAWKISFEIICMDFNNSIVFKWNSLKLKYVNIHIKINISSVFFEILTFRFRITNRSVELPFQCSSHLFSAKNQNVIKYI